VSVKPCRVVTARLEPRRDHPQVAAQPHRASSAYTVADREECVRELDELVARASASAGHETAARSGRRRMPVRRGPSSPPGLPADPAAARLDLREGDRQAGPQRAPIDASMDERVEQQGGVWRADLVQADTR